MARLGPTQRGSPSTVRPRLGATRTVASGRVGIASTLAAEGASMPAQTAGDLGRRIALKLHSVEDLSFVHGKRVVRPRAHSVV